MEPRYIDNFTPTDEHGFAIGSLEDELKVTFSSLKKNFELKRLVVVATYEDGSTEIVEIESKVRKKRK